MNGHTFHENDLPAVKLLPMSYRFIKFLSRSASYLETDLIRVRSLRIGKRPT